MLSHWNSRQPSVEVGETEGGGEEHRRSCLMSECLLNIQVEI